MALITVDQAKQQARPYLSSMNRLPSQVDPVGWGRTLYAGFRQANPLAHMGRLFDVLGVDIGEAIEFDPMAHIPKGYEDYALNFIAANNERDIEAIRERIDRDFEDRRDLAASGWRGMASMLGAGLLDPIALMFPASGAYKLAASGKAITTARASGEFALMNLLGVAASEMALQQGLETKTLTESAADLFTAGTVGAGMGIGLSRGGGFRRTAKWSAGAGAAAGAGTEALLYDERYEGSGIEHVLSTALVSGLLGGAIGKIGRFEIERLERAGGRGYRGGCAGGADGFGKR